MKMLLLAYCEAADYDLITTLRKAGIKGDTKFTEVFGEGKETQPRLEHNAGPERIISSPSLRAGESYCKN